MSDDLYKVERWGRHFRDWQLSGLTREQYCEREGLSRSTFSYWRTRLKKQSRADGEGKLTLVPVRIRDAEPEGRLVLRSPAGWSVALPTSANADWVAGVLKHLP